MCAQATLLPLLGFPARRATGTGAVVYVLNEAHSFVSRAAADLQTAVGRHAAKPAVAAFLSTYGEFKALGEAIAGGGKPKASGPGAGGSGVAPTRAKPHIPFDEDPNEAPELGDPDAAAAASAAAGAGHGGADATSP